MRKGQEMRDPDGDCVTFFSVMRGVTISEHYFRMHTDKLFFLCALMGDIAS